MARSYYATRKALVPATARLRRSSPDPGDIGWNTRRLRSDTAEVTTSGTDGPTHEIVTDNALRNVFTQSFMLPPDEFFVGQQRLPRDELVILHRTPVRSARACKA